MRQVVFRKFYIFSANLSNLSTKDNHLRTREAYNTLLDLGLDFACVTGVFKGVTESSFLIFDGDNVESNVKTLSGLYNQECYLVRDRDNEGYLVNNEGVRESIGTPKEVTREETISLESFTILPQGDNTKKYFTFVKEQ